MAYEDKISEMTDAVVSAVIFLIPSAVASVAMSLSDFFNRHYGKDPFSIATLVIGLLTDTMYGVLITAVYWGMGGRSFMLAIAFACLGVHFGIRSMEDVARKMIMQKYGIKLEWHREENNVENACKNCNGQCPKCGERNKEESN